MIKSITELLVELGIFDTLRKASNAVKKGEVYVNDIRVANTDALLVIAERVYIQHKKDGQVLCGTWSHDD